LIKGDGRPSGHAGDVIADNLGMSRTNHPRLHHHEPTASAFNPAVISILRVVSGASAITRIGHCKMRASVAA
jgi:hypothetical protein